MNLRFLVAHVIAIPVFMMSMTFAQSNSATHVAAELTQGKLSPAASKPGDSVAVRLKDDLRSNGQVVLKKGTVISGVVRNIGRSDAKAYAQSMLEVEWLVPVTDGRTARSLSIALQSVTQATVADRADEEVDPFTDEIAAPLARTDRPVRSAGGEDVASAAANPALLSMPSVVAVDHQTSSAIETSLDSSAPEPLFKVGHGELVTAGGVHESVDLFSHLNNDTVITSPSRNFEISSGAQMQLLVGIRK
jgi:hypothetical protein